MAYGGRLSSTVYYPFGFEVVSDFMQLNDLWFKETPEPLDEDVGQVAASAIH